MKKLGIFLVIVLAFILATPGISSAQRFGGHGRSGAFNSRSFAGQNRSLQHFGGRGGGGGFMRGGSMHSFGGRANQNFHTHRGLSDTRNFGAERRGFRGGREFNGRHEFFNGRHRFDRFGHRSNFVGRRPFFVARRPFFFRSRPFFFSSFGFSPFFFDPFFFNPFFFNPFFSFNFGFVIR